MQVIPTTAPILALAALAAPLPRPDPPSRTPASLRLVDDYPLHAMAYDGSYDLGESHSKLLSRLGYM